MPDSAKIDEPCMRLAIDFIKESARKYQVDYRSEIPPAETIASNVLIGEIGHDIYLDCLHRRAIKVNPAPQRSR